MTWFPNKPLLDPESNWFNHIWRFFVGVSHISVIQTADFTVADEFFYPCDASGFAGGIIVNLPPASLYPHKQYVFKKLNPGAIKVLTLTADTTVPDLIDGSATYVVSGLNTTVRIMSDGVSNWYII